MAKRLWAGLDVGVETTSICVMDDNGEILHQAVCPTASRSVHREIAFIKRRKFARVGLESGCGVSIARCLRNLGYSVDIYDARQLHKFLSVRRNKTDAGDASGLAHAGRLGANLVAKVHLKDIECQALAARLAIRRQLISSRVRAVNLLCRQFELFGGRITRCPSAMQLREKVEGQIKMLFRNASTPLVNELRQLLERCESLWAHQKQLDQQLRKSAMDQELCRRLMEIPGIGPICALTFYACIDDPNRFRKSSDVGAYLGLTPRLHQSGLSLRSGRISKLGSRPMRALLVQASTCFMRCADPANVLRTWASDVEGRRGRSKARVALARKLAVVMLAMWKTGRPYEQGLSEARLA